MHRKDFIKTAGRVVMLGGMTAATGYLFIRRKVDTNCGESGICKDCSKLYECEFPKAKEVRDGKE